MSVRDRGLTEQEMSDYVKNDADLKPWGGAGSISAADAVLGKKNRQPTDARGRMHHNERAAFAEANQEATPLTPEEMKYVNDEVAQSIALGRDKKYFGDAIRRNVPLYQSWIDAGAKAEDFPFFKGLIHGDASEISESEWKPALNGFVRSPMFAPYTTNTQQRDEVIRMLLDFLTTNIISLGVMQNYLRCFKTLELLGVLPAPVPTAAQVDAQERNKSAADGNPVALKPDGKPVVYNLRGTPTRYSQKMLDALTADGYATVMGIRKQSLAEINVAEEQRRQLKAKDYRTTVMAGGYTEAELDAMTSEKYRKVMNLERDGGGRAGDRL